MHHNQNHKKYLFKCLCQDFHFPLETFQWILLSEHTVCKSLFESSIATVTCFFLLHLRGENLLSLWTSSKAYCQPQMTFQYCFLWLTHQSWCVTTLVFVTDCFCCPWASCADDERNLDQFTINFYQLSISGVCPCSDCTKQCYRTSEMLFIILKVLVITAKYLLLEKIWMSFWLHKTLFVF